MPDKKITDSEIVKALECCTQGRDIKVCWDCPLYVDLETARECCEKLNANTLDLINRQKADIKKLTSGKCVYLSDDETTEYCVEGPCPNYKTVAQIKAEAYKEFAERLKEEFMEGDNEMHFEWLVRYRINKLLKELVGETDASE